MIEVEAVALDSYFAQGSKVDFIKIDAEGAEIEILRGMSGLPGWLDPKIFLPHDRTFPSHFDLPRRH